MGNDLEGVDDAALMSEAEKLCMHFAAAPSEALAFIKSALDAAWDNDLTTQLDLERDLQHAASLTADYAEGVRAFVEKRAPKFTGRKEVVFRARARPRVTRDQLCMPGRL